jgi:hypothetical protein
MDEFAAQETTNISQLKKHLKMLKPLEAQAQKLIFSNHQRKRMIEKLAEIEEELEELKSQDPKIIT